jgi:diketogulonate reductase-like aldo/keto reductase
MKMVEKVKLNNGIEMPILGLGTWQSNKGKECHDAVSWALEAGYRHIDTAAIYGNEESVGAAIKKSGIPRKEIFVTTKLWNSDHGNPQLAFEQSLKRLKLDYVDLYLIHFPVTGVRNNTWKEMEKILDAGKTRAIGVSNFTIKHLTELLKIATVVPAVNQVEFSPYLYQKDLMDFCREKNIQLEAYSPLTRREKLKDPKLLEIAAKYNKTAAQVMIRWCIEHNVVAIPKSVTRQRIQENFNVFDFNISKEDMRKLDFFNENLRLCWNPEVP